MWVSTLVMEAEIEAVIREMADSLTGIDAHLEEVQRRLRENYEALESRVLSLEDLAPRIRELRSQEDQLTETRKDAQRIISEQGQIEGRITPDLARGAARELRACLEEGTFDERSSIVHFLVERILVDGDEFVVTFRVPIDIEVSLKTDQELEMERWAHEPRTEEAVA